MEKRKQQNPWHKTICIAYIAAGFLIATFGWYYEKTVQHREIKTYEGPFQQYTIKTSSRSVDRFFSVGDKVFRLNSTGLPAFNRAFSSDVQADETVFVEYWDKEGAADSVPRTLLGLRTEKAVYMDSSDTLAHHIRIYRLAVFWGIVVLTVGVINVFFDDGKQTTHPSLRTGPRRQRGRSGKMR